MGKFYFDILVWIVVGIIIGASAYFIYSNFLISKPTNTTVLGPSNALSPSSSSNIMKQAVAIVVLTSSRCVGCPSIEPIAQQLQGLLTQLNIEVKKIDRLDEQGEDGKKLVSKYNLVKFPTLIILFEGTGARNQEFVTTWTQQVGTEESDGSLILRNPYPPYFDMSKNKTVGLVRGVAIKAANCIQCLDSANFFNTLEGGRYLMVFKEKRILEENDSLSQELIGKHKIKKLPTMILDSETKEYPPFVREISPLGSYENDTFVLRDIYPPYKDLEDKSVVGLISETHIVNNSCASCANLSAFSDYLSSSVGLAIVNSTSYDYNSSIGRTIISKYNITRIPALILSKETSAYPNFDRLWQAQGNTIEKDGSFIFRSHESANLSYQNLTS